VCVVLGMYITVLSSMFGTRNMMHTVTKVCGSVYVIPLIVAWQRIGEHVPAATRIVGGIVFYAVRVVSKESIRLVLVS
jgi:hypothetical protein